MRQTMVDSYDCLDQVVPEGMSQVSRRSEVAYINEVPSTPGYVLALLRELLHVPRGLTKIAESKTSRYEKRITLVFCTSFKKWV